ncbi:MAG: hypothetical protein ISS95_00775 [Candidatus Aenigmarchaeota archaeon]|nr:hypothetical protein [Candidatus Aenigmarchaeota archaeon]
MAIFKELDEIAQTATVLVIAVVIISVVYLLWTLSIKIFGFLLVIFGAATLYYTGMSMKTHQYDHFRKVFNYMGIIFIILGIIFLFV